MPTIGPASQLSIGRKPKGLDDNNSPLHKFIKASLVKDLDMQNQNYNLVIDANWYSGEEGDRVNGRSIDFDISQNMRSGGIANIASVYIDNGAGNGTLSLEVLSTGQRISCPPNYQGWFPVIAPKEDGKFRVGYSDKYNGNGLSSPSWYIPATVTGGIFPLPSPFTLNMFFTDLAVPPTVWKTQVDAGFIPNSSLLDIGSVSLTGGVVTPLTGGPGNNRVGLRIRADESNAYGVIVDVVDPSFNPVSVFPIWFLLPGESIVFEGPNTPYNAFQLFCIVDALVQWFEVI